MIGYVDDDRYIVAGLGNEVLEEEIEGVVAMMLVVYLYYCY